jgi:hypothetical protein
MVDPPSPSASAKLRRDERLRRDLELIVERRKQTSNPPTPKASAWQALTCLAVGRRGGRRRNAQYRSQKEIAKDLKKLWTGGPESRVAEVTDTTAAFSAFINATIFEHPALFRLYTSAAQAGRSIGMD